MIFRKAGYAACIIVPSIITLETGGYIMKRAILEHKKIFHEVNSITGSVGSVIFGGECFAGLPVAELVQDFGLNVSACNRSVEGILLAEAFELLEACVFELSPRKVFLNFGEADLLRQDFDRETFLADYVRLIEAIHAGCNGKVYVVSVPENSGEAARLNADLRVLADACGCGYVDVADSFRREKPHLRLFSELMHCMREGRISFTEDMHAV